MLYMKTLKRRKSEKIQSFNGTVGSPGSPCLSPEILVGIKYYSLNRYIIDDLRVATGNFGSHAKIDDLGASGAYKGQIDGGKILIRQMKHEEARNVIGAHSRINHKNILNLLGVCFQDGNKTEDLWSYLVLEWPRYGSLRSCLTNQENRIPWQGRAQIASDVAMAIHYLHYCIVPSYAHIIISSRNAFIAAGWRAKIANISASSSHGESERADMFSFGVLLLELISGKAVDTIDGGKECQQLIAFFNEGEGIEEGDCLKQLRSFVDARLQDDDYPVAEATCLVVLAKACVEDDPLRRPSMDDIIKILARMV